MNRYPEKHIIHGPGSRGMREDVLSWLVRSREGPPRSILFFCRDKFSLLEAFPNPMDSKL